MKQVGSRERGAMYPPMTCRWSECHTRKGRANRIYRQASLMRSLIIMNGICAAKLIDKEIDTARSLRNSTGSVFFYFTQTVDPGSPEWVEKIYLFLPR